MVYFGLLWMEKMKGNPENMKFQRKLVRKYPLPFFSDSLAFALKTLLTKLPIFSSESHLHVIQAAACLPKYSRKHI